MMKKAYMSPILNQAESGGDVVIVVGPSTGTTGVENYYTVDIDSFREAGHEDWGRALIETPDYFDFVWMDIDGNFVITYDEYIQVYG